MKLKGKILRKMSNEKFEKMQKTLFRMNEIRAKDSQFLRKLIKDKLDWAVSEKQLGIDTIEKIKAQCLKLEGIIIVLKELLEANLEKKV